ncbi:ribosome silencing factor [Govanella unica]|uniref:Ribosomal silencing factor RsfS n=1 Tax=Govanella unica TaxID=2975056 RepID=A0A9X3TVH2_9PROT|nr:ribosome silencing factor [Govania unica]
MRPEEQSPVERKDAKPGLTEPLHDAIIRSLDQDKAEDIIAIDLAGKTSFADHMIIANGRSSRQVAAMASHLIERLKEWGIRPRAEGMSQGDWVLIDAGDVVVHLFRPEVRDFYNLEKMWSAAVIGEAV